MVSVFDMASEEELRAEIERLRSENEKLKKPARGQMSLKVSEKGALSVYGLGRFPVTLYREQWEKLLGMADQIREFIQANDGALKKKDVESQEMKTNAARALDSLGIRYELREYAVDPEDLAAETVAAKIGLPPSRYSRHWSCAAIATAYAWP